MTEPAEPQRRTDLAVAAAYLVQALLLVATALHNWREIDSDGIAYLELARHWAGGRWGLAVAPYWGPLLSWLMAPFTASDDPLLPARVVMAVSGVVFLAGSVAVLRAFELPRAGVVLGAWLCALSPIFPTVFVIKPDLLLAGIVCFAVARLVSADWADRRRTQIAVGLLLGLGYLAKPVGFAIAVVLPLAFAARLRWIEGRGWPDVRRAALTTFAGFAIVAVPWIAAVSHSYGHLTYSTSPAINHALVSPANAHVAVLAGHHPTLEGWRPPPEGRLFGWEDPTCAIDEYPKWSAFGSRAELNHQLTLVRANLRIVSTYLRDADLLGLGLIALVAGGLLHRPWRENLRREKWRSALLPVACVCGLYLPVFADQARFYHVAYPFLVVAAVGMANWLVRSQAPSSGLVRSQAPSSEKTVPGTVRGCAALAVVGVTFGFVAVTDTVAAVRGGAVEQAHDPIALAARLEAAHVEGSLAGYGWWRAQYVAFFARRRWYGSSDEGTPEEAAKSGADLVIVRRRTPHAAALAASPEFEDLDGVLFGAGEDAASSRLSVFRVRR